MEPEGTPVSGLKQLKKNELLFREGDPSDAMFVIKSGKIAITKAKGTSEVVLAELGPGDMLGEMAFFDNRPRSAGAKAVVDTVIIELPFKALNAQFKTFPEWLKAIVRTVNNHLRNANQTIKNLQKSAEEENEYFPPFLINRLMAVLGLVTARFGDREADGGIDVSANLIRRYTIQVFQQPTAKMEKLMELLASFGYLKIEDLGEGRQKIVVYRLDDILNFVDFHNEWLFKAEDKRITINEKEMKPMKALIHYGKKETPNDKGEVRVNLTAMQAECMTELQFPFSADDVNTLVDKKLTGVKMSIEGGIVLTFKLKDLEDIYPHWDLIHACKRIQKT